VKLRPAPIATWRNTNGCGRGGRENERAKQHADVFARIQSEYADAISAHRDHENEIQKRHSATQKEMVRLEGDRGLFSHRSTADRGHRHPREGLPQCGYIDPNARSSGRSGTPRCSPPGEGSRARAGRRGEAAGTRGDRRGEHLPPEKPKLRRTTKPPSTGSSRA
jgi:hypothetical protein